MRQIEVVASTSEETEISVSVQSPEMPKPSTRAIWHGNEAENYNSGRTRTSKYLSPRRLPQQQPEETKNKMKPD